MKTGCAAIAVNKGEPRRPAIYGLHAGDGVIRYVGATTQNAKIRLQEHISRANSGHPAPVYQWMRETGVHQVATIELEAVDVVAKIRKTEAATIARLLADGAPLVNQLARDGVPDSWSQESKKKSGDIKRGKATWIKGKTGEAAGWSRERRAAQSARIKKYNAAKMAA